MEQRNFFFIPAFIVCICGLFPLVYLIAKAIDAEGAVLVENLFRTRNARLFLNTVLLTIGVLILDILLATPAAWLTTHANLRGKRIFSVLCTLPLAIPGYVMAYALLGLGGNNGIFASLFGKSLPRLSGYWGALIALSFYTSPYLFLNLRSALLGLDPNLEESARSLGHKQWSVFIRVILPQLRPAFYASGLLICLHVLGDFGVVSLMRFETFSYALYVEYEIAFDGHNYASWLALLLLAFTGCLLFLETRLLRSVVLHRAGHGVSRHRSPIPLGKWKSAGYTFLILLFIATVVIPAITVFLWMFRAFEVSALDGLLEALTGSVGIAVPSAICCAILVVPFAYIGVRYSSRFSNMLARIPYVIYAIPPLAFALAIILFLGSPQTILLLICACILHFLAEAIGPVRSSLYQASPNLEEAARSLGSSPVGAFFRAVFPLIIRGMLTSTALVFLATMKELPLTLLLRPAEYETLAVNVWDYTGEAMFAQAAPYAFLILLFSALFVGLLIRKEDA
ncbi:iron ABC transporter permease [Candidatus Poribacteria bacterium]|nr:iron ABC transporter permease [Candidatus Poribacteria bacterium]